jgi:hypothetical protein
VTSRKPCSGSAAGVDFQAFLIGAGQLPIVPCAKDAKIEVVAVGRLHARGHDSDATRAEQNFVARPRHVTASRDSTTSHPHCARHGLLLYSHFCFGELTDCLSEYYSMNAWQRRRSEIVYICTNDEARSQSPDWNVIMRRLLYEQSIHAIDPCTCGVIVS